MPFRVKRRILHLNLKCINQNKSILSAIRQALGRALYPLPKPLVWHEFRGPKPIGEVGTSGNRFHDEIS